MHAPADAAPRFTRGVLLGKRGALPSMLDGVATLPAAVCTAVISIIDEALFSMESFAATGSAKEVLKAREVLVARATQQLGSPPIVSLDALAAMDLDARTYVLALSARGGNDDDSGDAGGGRLRLGAGHPGGVLGDGDGGGD